MYKIIGADGQEYGPVTGEQLRQWVREGRANGQSKVQPEGSIEWKTLDTLAEFSDLFGAPAVATTPVGTAQVPVGPATLDIGHCISRSWNLLKQHFAIIIGVTFLISLILGGVGIGLRFGANAISGLSLQDVIHARGLRGLRMQWRGLLASNLWFWVMTGPLVGGLYNFFLKLIRGQPAGVGDAFAGFGPQFGQLVLGSIAVSILTVIGLLCCLIPGIYLSVCWKFTLPSIIDKRLNCLEGLKTSRRSLTGRWWSMFALILLSSLIATAGLLVCCIGILVTAPIAIGAIAYAYEDLIGVQLPASS